MRGRENMEIVDIGGVENMEIVDTGGVKKYNTIYS